MLSYLIFEMEAKVIFCDHNVLSSLIIDYQFCYLYYILSIVLYLDPLKRYEEISFICSIELTHFSLMSLAQHLGSLDYYNGS